MTAKFADIQDTLAAKLEVPSNQFTVDIAKNIGYLGLAALGLGAGVRGARGLADTAADVADPPPLLSLRRQFVSVPVPRRREKERAPRALQKAAEEIQKLGDSSFMDNPAGWVMDKANMLPRPDRAGWSALSDTFVNPDSTHVWQKPWVPAAAVATGLGGVYLGHTLADKAIGAAKDNALDSELKRSKTKYEALLRNKVAEDSPLDRAYEACEKRGEVTSAAGYALADRLLAGHEKQAKNWGVLSGALGAYGLAAGLTGLASGIAAYKWSREGSQTKAVEEALKQRRAQMFAKGPAPLVLTPEEYDPEVSPPTPPHTSEADLKQRYHAALHKRSNLGTTAAATLARFQQQKAQAAANTAALYGVKPEKPKDSEPPPPSPPASVAHNL